MQIITIPLDQPIQRGGSAIDSIDIRKPGPGEMRGLTMRAIADINVDAMIKIIPRISTPALTEAEVAAMDLSDFTAIASEVSSFLLTRAQRLDSLLE